MSELLPSKLLSLQVLQLLSGSQHVCRTSGSSSFTTEVPHQMPPSYPSLCRFTLLQHIQSGNKATSSTLLLYEVNSSVGKGLEPLGRHKAKAGGWPSMEAARPPPGRRRAEQMPVPALTTHRSSSLAGIFSYSMKNQGTKPMTSNEQCARSLLSLSTRAFPFCIPLLQACTSHFSSWSRLQALFHTSTPPVFLSPLCLPTFSHFSFSSAPLPLQHREQ